MAFPNLQIYPETGLTFPWCEFLGEAGSTSDMSAGHDGTTAALTILIRYTDLEDALLQILGGTTRVPALNSLGFTYYQLSRIVPMQHPRFNQLWCTKIASVRGIQFIGQTRYVDGPLSTTTYVMLTLAFTRPPYPVLADFQTSTITLASAPPGGLPMTTTFRQEWTRYCDQNWKISSQMLTRRGMTMKFDEGAVQAPKNVPLPGSIGTKVTKLELVRRWYQIPHLAIFNTNGFPTIAQIHPFLAGIAGVPPVGFYNDSNSYIMGTVNSDTFLGSEPETLLLTSLDIVPQPLPFPAILLGIIGESQYPFQYDIIFHFDYNRQQRGVVYPTITLPGPVPVTIPGPGTPPSLFVNSVGGHNDLPWAGDNRWYRVKAQAQTSSSQGTIYQPYPFNWLFTIR